MPISKSALLVCSDYTLGADLLFKVFMSLKIHAGDCCIDYARTHRVYEASESLMKMAVCRVIRHNAAWREANGQEQTSGAWMDKPLGLDRLHAFFGKRKATDTRDHVIGLLGLLDLDHHIIPNYTSSIQQVFIDATVACIKARNDLRVLELVSHSPKITRGLSSWAMDWVSMESRAFRLPPNLRHMQIKVYDASRSRRAQYSVSQDQRAITVDGIFLGSITELVLPAAGLPKPDDTEHRRHIIEERLRLTGFEEPLSDTMLLGLDEHREETRCEPLLVTAMTIMQGIKATLVDWYNRGKEEERLHPIEQWVNEAEWRESLKQSVDGRVNHEWKDLEASLTTNNFFATSDKRMGSCAAMNTDLARGDRVAVLYGLDMPVLLRKVGAKIVTSSNAVTESCNDGAEGLGARKTMEPETYQFLGVAYVHGLMDGEALDLAGAGEARVESITLV